MSRFPLIVAGLLTAATISSAQLSNGDFEASPFDIGWSNAGAVATSGFALGSNQAVRFTGGGQTLRQDVSFAGDWHLEFWFMVKQTSNRQFSLIVDTGNYSPAINLRYENGWYAFSGGWGSQFALGSVAASIDQNGDGDLDDAGDVKNVYRMCVTGNGWGSPGASYDLELSDANGTAFTSSVTGLSRYQAGSPTTQTPSRITFGTEFGSNPGFWLDDVSDEDNPLGGAPAIQYFVANDNTLSWQVENAGTLTLSPGAIDVTGLSSFTVTPATTTTYTLTAGSDSQSFTIGVGEPVSPVIINEFLAINPAGDDWIELYNPNAFSVNLDGWGLTDDALRPEKFTFSPRAIAPGGYLLVDSDLFEFSLSGSGEYLGLSDADGEIESEFAPSFPIQYQGVSYGADGYFGIPTPGAANQPSPFLSEYTANINPDGSVEVTVTAGSSAGAITDVQLHYRAMYAAESSVSMTDSGGGIHTAIIPAGSATSGQMLRWRISAEEAGGQISKLPPFPDPVALPEYFGTVVADPSLSSALPILQWFQNGGGSETRTGTRCSIFWNGEFYDNVLVHLRGATTATLEKKAHQFEFNPGHNFRIVDGMARVDQINVNAAYPDSSYLRDILPMEHLREMGVPTPETFAIRVERNGDFHSLGIMIEQPDNEFLQRHDEHLDPDGAMFKATGNGSWLISANGFEARNGSDLAHLSAFASSLNGAGQLNFLLENVDLPSVVNYLAVNVVDSIFNPQKNYYMHQNRFGEWMILPWDRDFSYGHRWLGAGDSRGPAGPTGFLVTDERYEWGGSNNDFKGGYNRLFDAVFANADTSEMFYRRLRTVMDTLLAPNVIETRIEELRTMMKPEADLDRAEWGFTSDGSYGRFPQESFDLALDRIKNDYLPARRTFLETDGGSPKRGTLPSSQPFAPPINFGTIVTNPSSGNQDEESIELQNANAFAVDVSGWKITGGVTHTLRPGTVIPAGSSLFLSPDVETFRSISAPVFAQGNYDGHLSNFSEVLTLANSDGTAISTISTPDTPSDNQRYLRISEIMYNPASGDEFIELVNTSDAVTLDLAAVTFTAGIDYSFPDPSLLIPGARIVVNFSDFISGRLSNGGERIKLDDADGSTISEFSYDDQAPWPTPPDGSGPSLVYRGGDPDLPQNWRASLASGGNPGTSDSVPYTGGDLIDYAFSGTAEIQLLNESLEIMLAPGADDVEILPQWSTDLTYWHDDGFEFQSSGKWELPPSLGERMFFRFRVSLR